MNTGYNVNADFTSPDGKVNVKVVLVSFKEGDYNIVYSPHLEVSGYGTTESEAIDSFNIGLREFLDYTVKKRTLHKELIKLGWELKKGTSKRPKKITAPSWESMLKENSSLEEILNTQDIKTTHKEVAIPV